MVGSSAGARPYQVKKAKQASLDAIRATLPVSADLWVRLKLREQPGGLVIAR